MHLLLTRKVSLVLLLALGATCTLAQDSGGKAIESGFGINLYRRLMNVGIDRQRVFRIRDGSIDREEMHISLNDGTIGFTQAVDGRITGALFVGEGEILLIPPNHTERQSLALFTNAAVLSESFSLAYFRFCDDKLVSDLQVSLRPADDAAEFIQKYDVVAKNLAESDALRALLSLTRVPAKPSASTQAPRSLDFLHARFIGVHLGAFDVELDTSASEQISVSQAAYTDHGRYYDQWTSFPMNSVRSEASPLGAVKDAALPVKYYEPLRITSYQIHADVRPPNNVAMETSVEVDVRSSGERAFVFELSRYLKVSSVLDNSNQGSPQGIEFLQNEAIEGSQLNRRGNDLVTLIFPRPLRSGEHIRLTFNYAGSVLADAGGGLLYVGARGTWYPNFGPAMCDFDLEFRYPAGWKLLATGKLLSRAQDARNNEEVSHWKSEGRIPLAGFNIGRYVSATAESKTHLGTTTVETFAAREMERSFLPGQNAPSLPSVTRPGGPLPLVRPLEAVPFSPDPARHAQAVAEQAASAIDFLSLKLGPFPYTTLFLTQRPGGDSQGWPGLVFLSSYVFLSPQERTAGRKSSELRDVDQILYDKLMVPHETAHQWWGDAVFWRDYRSQWIMEAMANYCALLKLEAEAPKEFAATMEAYRRELQEPARGAGSASNLTVKDAGAVSLGVRLNSSKFPNGYSAVIYGRGTWLIHMLRHMLRDAEMASGETKLSAREHEPRRPSSLPVASARSTSSGAASPTISDPSDARFFAVLRGIQDKFHGQLISNRNLQEAFEAALPATLNYEGKRSLDWFFEGWVDGNALPTYELRGVKFTTSASRTIANAQLLQKDAPDALVTSVPIYASSGAGALIFVGRVFADGEETALKLTVPAGTKSLAIDPFHTVLMGK